MELGVRGDPAHAPAAPDVTGGPRRPNATVLVAGLAVAVIGVGAWLLLSALTAGPAVTTGEGSFAVRSFAINRFGYGAAHLPWYDGGLGALQVAGYETISGALGRAATMVAAAREAVGVAVVLAAVALTVAAHRLRLSGPAVVAVPALFLLVPAAVELHRTADPAQLGVLWACAALALAGGEARRIGAAVGCVAYLAAAVTTSPLVSIALVPLFTLLLWSGALGRLDRPARMAVGVAGAAVFTVLFVFAAAGSLPGGGDTRVPSFGPLDWLVAVAFVAAGLAGLRVGWLRPVAVALLATVLTAAVSSDLRGSLLLVALPLGAVVVPAVADVALAYARRRTGAAWLSGPVVVVGAVVVAALAWLPSLDTVRRPVDAPARTAVDDAQAWVLENLPTRPRLVVDDRIWAALVDAGYPAEQLAPAGGFGPDRTAWPDGWADARYAVGRDADLLAAADPVGAARRASMPVAAFGSGADQVSVRRVVTDPNAAAAAKQDEAGRISAGTALTSNPRLALQPGAATLLRQGRVDARLISVLVALTSEHSVQVADFPAVPGEDPASPRRLIAISALDSRSVQPASADATALRQWLAAQQPPYRPASTEPAQVGGRTVLLVRFDALATTGLLPP